MDENKKFRFSLDNLQMFGDDPNKGGNNPEPQNPEPKTGTNDEKILSQREFDETIGKRLERQNASWLKKLGIEKKEDVESLVNNAKAYGDMKSQYDALVQERDALLAEKTNAQYKHLIENSATEVDFVLGKLPPEKDEKTEDYQKRLDEFLKEHPAFAKGTQGGQKVTSGPVFEGKAKATGRPSLRDAVIEELGKVK